MELTYNLVTAKGAQHLANVRLFVLRACSLPCSECFFFLAQALETNKSLRTLLLDHNAVGDAGNASSRSHNIARLAMLISFFRCFLFVFVRPERFGCGPTQA